MKYKNHQNEIGACSSCKWARAYQQTTKMLPYDGGQQGRCANPTNKPGTTFSVRDNPDMSIPVQECWEQAA